MVVNVFIVIYYASLCQVWSVYCKSFFDKVISGLEGGAGGRNLTTVLEL